MVRLLAVRDQQPAAEVLSRLAHAAGEGLPEIRFQVLRPNRQRAARHDQRPQQGSETCLIYPGQNRHARRLCLWDPQRAPRRLGIPFPGTNHGSIRMRRQGASIHTQAHTANSQVCQRRTPLAYAPAAAGPLLCLQPTLHSRSNRRNSGGTLRESPPSATLTTVCCLKSRSSLGRFTAQGRSRALMRRIRKGLMDEAISEPAVSTKKGVQEK
jgi:hypothetical protein